MLLIIKRWLIFLSTLFFFSFSTFSNSFAINDYINPRDTQETNIQKEILNQQNIVELLIIEKDSLQIANTYLELGVLQKLVGQPLLAQASFFKAQSIFTNLGNKPGMAKVLNRLGEIFRIYKGIEEAMTYHLQALNLFIELKDTSGIISAKNNLGINYRVLKNLEKSQAYAKECLDLVVKNDDPVLIHIYNSFGSYFWLKQDYDSSIYYYKQGLKITPQNFEEKERLGVILNNLSYIYRIKNEVDSTNKYLDISLRYNVFYQFKNTVAANYEVRSSAFLSKNQLDSALFYNTKSFQLAQETNYINKIQTCFLNFSEIYAGLGDFRNAHLYFKKYTDIKDSVFSMNDAEKIAQIRIENIENQRNKIEAILLQDLAKKDLIAKNYSYNIKLYIVIIIFLFTIIVLGFFLYRSHSKSKENLRKLNEKLEERVRERTLNLTNEIDSHKKTEIELKQNEERWDQAQEVGNVGNWEYNINNNILWGSKQSFKILKIKKSQTPIYTSQILQRIHPDDFKRVARKLRKLKNSNKKLHLEFRLKSANSNEIFVLVKAEVIYNLKLSPIKVLGTIQNITNRKIVENELVKAKEKAEESDRLKSAFLSNMSHEIRTPMNAVIGFSDLLADPTFDEQTKKEHIQLIQSNSNKLMNLIDDIIDIAKIEANQIKIRESACDLNTLMNELYKTFKQNSTLQIEFVMNTPANLHNPYISTDSFRLQQIISNLLSNAFKFTDTGKIEFGYSLHQNQLLEFYVSDTGIGIPKESHKIIFERFRQAEESNSRLYGGTGLGLAICKYLINLMGGDIRIESDINQGSIFYFTLPYKQISINPLETIVSNKGISDWGNKTILIAEDEKDSFTLLKTMLKNTKINVLQANTGNDVLNILAENKNIDLILMDLQMPGMNGIEATKKIKSKIHSIPIIAQTAFALSDDKQKCNEAGFDNYITKPINKNILLNMLASYLEN